jgi:hypothetical protein
MVPFSRGVHNLDRVGCRRTNFNERVHFELESFARGTVSRLHNSVVDGRLDKYKLGGKGNRLGLDRLIGLEGWIGARRDIGGGGAAGNEVNVSVP